MKEEALWVGKFSLGSLATALGAVLRVADEEVVAGRVVTDSRQVGPGDGFVALVGERFDAHDFVQEAWKKGAVAALVSKAVKGDGPQLVVPDTLAGLQQLGAFLWRRYVEAYEPWSVALTGSNGKTTTREMLRMIFGTLTPRVYATSGNYNNHIGVPLTLCALPQGTTGVVVEMGANKVGDIRELIELAPTKARLITSIGPAHLEGFGSMEGVRQGKSEIFREATATTLGVVPWSEKELPVRQGFPGRVLTFGQDPRADVHIHHAQHDQGRLEVGVRLPGGRDVQVSLPLVGLHNADNVAGALAVAWGLWGELPSQEVLERALWGMEVPGGRWRTVEVGQRWHVVDDAYNANPGSVKVSFESFLVWQRSKPAGLPRIAVLGEMLELGDEAKNWHEQMARSISESDDLSGLMCVGRFAPQMAKAAKRSGGGELMVLQAKNAEEAALLLVHHWQEGVVWLKASRGMRLERIISAIQDEAPAP